MKDLSPSERSALERAAQIMPVYERVEKETRQSYRSGCFNCDHDAPSMARQGRYMTTEIRTTPTYDDEGHMLNDSAHIISFVMCWDDKFWASGRHWLPKLMGEPQYYPQYGIQNRLVYELEDSPEIYVRIWYIISSYNVQHVNSKINIWNMMLEQDIGYEQRITIYSSPIGRGVYVDPKTTFLSSSFINSHRIFIHPDLNDSELRGMDLVNKEGPILQALHETKDRKKKQPKWFTTEEPSVLLEGETDDSTATFQNIASSYSITPTEQDNS